MPEVIAPLRIDLGGGETDVDYISRVIGTCIVNTGIDPYLDPDYRVPASIYCSARHDGNGPLQFAYNDEPVDLNLDGDSDEFSFFRLFLKALSELDSLPPAFISLKNELPKGTGLGGSSVMAICLVALMQELKGENVGNLREGANSVIKLAHYIETNQLMLTGGHQDYVGAYFGKLNCIEFSSVPEVDFTDPSVLCGLDMESEMRRYLSNNLVVVVLSEGNQSSSDILNDQIRNYAIRPAEMRRLLQGMKDMNKQMLPILVDPGKLSQRLEQLGSMVNYCWDIKKQLSTKVGTGLLREIEIRIRSRVLGLTGPGAGGNSLAIITREGNRAQIIENLEEYRDKVTLLFPRINETGIQIK